MTSENVMVPGEGGYRRIEQPIGQRTGGSKTIRIANNCSKERVVVGEGVGVGGAPLPVTKKPKPPKPWTSFALWQFSWKGAIPGIPATPPIVDVDEDRFFGVVFIWFDR